MKLTTPFKAAAEFEKELTDFANIHKTTLAEHSKRISEYFEMSCYNLIVRYYEKKGYTLEVQNLQSGRFRFKCSPKGFLSNFSYFKASKTNEDGSEEVFFIFHNATVQSSFDNDVFTTPDIVVSSSETPSEKKGHYATNMVLTYISKENLITFCEAKHLVPFAELMVCFTGTVHELKPECMSAEEEKKESNHIAPSLMMSGTLSKTTRKIKDSMESRYYINYLDNLFEDKSVKLFHSKAQMNEISTLGKKSEKADKAMNNYSQIFTPEQLKEILDNV